MVGDVDDPLADGILAKYYSQKVKDNETVKVKKKIGFIWEREGFDPLFFCADVV